MNRWHLAFTTLILVSGIGWAAASNKPRIADAPAIQLPAIPIKIKCPCDMHQAEGFVEISGAGTIIIGQKTTDYSGGHWQSDSPISFENHAPQPAPAKDR